MNEVLVLYALEEYAVTEIHGPLHEERIMHYARETGIPYDGDEVPWCSLFCNFIVQRAGGKGTGALLARDWLKVGTPVATPKLGDIVVFWRGSPTGWKGHVGIFIRYSKDRKYIYVLGGNQSNQVNISPYATSRLLSFQRLEVEPTRFDYKL